MPSYVFIRYPKNFVRLLCNFDSPPCSMHFQSIRVFFCHCLLKLYACFILERGCGLEICLLMVASCNGCACKDSQCAEGGDPVLHRRDMELPYPKLVNAFLAIGH